MQTEQTIPYIVHNYKNDDGTITTVTMPQEDANIRKATERAERFWNLFTKYRGMKS